MYLWLKRFNCISKWKEDHRSKQNSLHIASNQLVASKKWRTKIVWNVDRRALRVFADRKLVVHDDPVSSWLLHYNLQCSFCWRRHINKRQKEAFLSSHRTIFRAKIVADIQKVFTLSCRPQVRADAGAYVYFCTCLLKKKTLQTLIYLILPSKLFEKWEYLSSELQKWYSLTFWLHIINLHVLSDVTV